jgi:microcystin degradation protein MlrC
MRLFYAALALEANTFLPLPTSYQAFVEKLYFPPGQYPEKGAHQTGAMDAVRARARRGEIELVEGSCYAAQPGGAASRIAYERMRKEILNQLKAALPVDGAVFNLHGAMVAHGYDDCEGDFLAHVRALVGEKCVIGIELDPHCHLTEKRCALADVIVLFKE